MQEDFQQPQVHKPKIWDITQVNYSTRQYMCCVANEAIFYTKIKYLHDYTCCVTLSVLKELSIPYLN